MKRLIFLLCFAGSVLAQTVPGSYILAVPIPHTSTMAAGTQVVTGPISPSAYNDSYPSHWDVLGGGGFRSVSDTTERSAINANYRKEGMLVWCAVNDHTYKLAANLTSWTDLGILGSNIYNVNGTLTGNRILEGAGYALSMTNTGNIKLSAATNIFVTNPLAGLMIEHFGNWGYGAVYSGPNSIFTNPTGGFETGHNESNTNDDYAQIFSKKHLYLTTPGTYTHTVTNGQVLKLTDAAIGEVEYGDVSSANLANTDLTMGANHTVDGATFNWGLNNFGTLTFVANGATWLQGEPMTIGSSTATAGRLRIRTPGIVGSTVSVGQVLTLANTNGAVEFQAVSAGDALVANPLSQFASTTSAQLKTVLSDETGSGAAVFATSPALVTPSLGVASATSIAVTGGSGAGFINLPTQGPNPSAPGDGVSLFSDNSYRFGWINALDTFTRTFAGTLTANRIYTLPDVSMTFARTDSAQAFTGTQTFGALVATTVNGNTLTTGTGTLTIAAGKTVTQNSTITYTGTDGTTMTFPSTSASVARTDAANTFNGTQSFTGDISNTGNVLTSGNLGVGGSGVPSQYNAVFGAGSSGIRMVADWGINWTSQPHGSVNVFSGTVDTSLSRRSAANILLGSADAAVAVAQTISVQGVVAGTSNTAGAAFTIAGSQSTGTGAGGSILLQTSPAGSTGTSQNALVTQLTITSAGATIANGVVRFKGYTVATLPAGTVGDNAYVTDALAPAFLATVVGGGAIVTPVFYNGSNWVSH